MGKPCRYMQFIKPVFYYKSTKNQYQVLQVTHATPGLMIKSFSPQYQAILEKTSLVCCCWHGYSCCILVTIQMVTNLWYFSDIMVIHIDPTEPYNAWFTVELLYRSSGVH